MPLSGGPSLILASGPISWQGEHNRLNTCSPAAASCPNVGPAEAARAIPAITHILSICSPFLKTTSSSCLARLSPKNESEAALLNAHQPSRLADVALSSPTTPQVHNAGPGRLDASAAFVIRTSSSWQ